MRRPAFTLIEMLAVLALLGLLTALATVSLSGAVRAARANDTAEAVRALDRSIRDYAKRFGRTVTLRFDLSQGVVVRVEDGKPSVAYALPVRRVITRSDDRTAAEVFVNVSAAGYSPSYAVLVNASQGTQWIVFAGLSGQASVVNDEREVLDILAPARADAD